MQAAAITIDTALLGLSQVFERRIQHKSLAGDWTHTSLLCLIQHCHWLTSNDHRVVVVIRPRMEAKGATPQLHVSMVSKW
jgi:hypothetical protein